MRSPWFFTLKNIFLMIFLIKILIILVYLNHFRQYFLLICEKESISLWFWQDLCYVSDPISLINPNNSQFCILIVKNVIPIVFFMDFLPSNSSHFLWDLLFLSRISFGTSESIISLLILILFSRFSWTFILHLICKYIVFTYEFQKKIRITNK